MFHCTSTGRLSCGLSLYVHGNHAVATGPNRKSRAPYTWQPPPVVAEAANASYATLEDCSAALCNAISRWRMQSVGWYEFEGTFYSQATQDWSSLIFVDGMQKFIGPAPTEALAHKLRCIAVLVMQPTSRRMNRFVHMAQLQFGDDPLVEEVRRACKGYVKGDFRPVLHRLREEGRKWMQMYEVVPPRYNLKPGLRHRTRRKGKFIKALELEPPATDIAVKQTTCSQQMNDG